MNRTVSLLLVVGVVGCAASMDVGEVSQDVLANKCAKKAKKKCASTTATVGVEGGTVTTDDGLTMDIPFGALDHAVTLTVTSTTLDPDPAIGGSGTVYAFEPEGTVFSRPVEVTLPLPIGLTDATVYWTKLGSTTEYEPLRSTISGSTITAETFHFSLAQVGSPVNDPPIKGSAVTTWIISNPLVVPPDPLPRNRFSEPSFASFSDIGVLVGDGNGGFADELPAEADDPDVPGNFQIKNVPTGGDYMLRIGTDYLITSAPTVDLGINRGGVPEQHRTPLDPDAQIDVTIDNIESWQQGDILEFFTTEGNMWHFAVQDAACVRASPGDPCEFAPIADGATSTESILDTFFMSGGAEPASAVRTSDGHRAFVAQLRTRQSANDITYQAMSKIGEFASLDMAVSGVTSASVSLDNDLSTANTIAVDYRGSQWAAKTLQYGHPDQYTCDFGFCGGFVGVLAQAGFAQDGFYNANADLLLMFDIAGEDKNTGAMTYGSPDALGGQWGLLGVVRWSALVDYRLPGTSGLAQLSRGGQGMEWVTTPDKLNNQIITPPITAPRNIMVGGIPFFTGSSTNLGDGALTITWDAPEIIPQITDPSEPAPVRYTVVVRRLFVDGNNRTRGHRIASFTVFDQTSLTIPPGVLTATDTYIFGVSAAAGTSREGSDTFVDEPWRATLDVASANITSAIFGDARGSAIELQTIADGQRIPLGLATTATHVYWVDFGDDGWADPLFTGNGKLWRANLDGTGAVTLLEDLPGAQSVAIDGDTLWFTNYGREDGSVMRVELSSCEPGNCPVKTLADHLGFVTNGNGIVAKDGDVFWSSGAIYAIRATDPCNTSALPCTLEQLSPEGGVSVAADDANVYFTRYGDENAGTGVVLSVPRGGGPVVEIATGGSQTWDVHAQDGFVYYGNQAWFQPFAATIDRVPRDNADPATHVNVATGRHTGQEDPQSEIMKVFGIDATHAYYIDTYDRLMRARLDGSDTDGELLGLLPTGGCPQGNIVIASGAVYWTDTCSQAVHRYVLP